jgi:hypothetical protein
MRIGQKFARQGMHDALDRVQIADLVTSVMKGGRNVHVA